MDDRSKQYIAHLAARKNISDNTKEAYERDLRMFQGYLLEHGNISMEEVTPTTLNSYMIYLERQGYGNATIARKTAVLRGFFLYLFKQGIMREDVADMLECPRMERKVPPRTNSDIVNKLLAAQKGHSPKVQRDKAMIEVLGCTGILIEELIKLTVDDVRLDLGYLQCHFQRNQNAYPLNERSQEALKQYLEAGRGELLKGKDTDILFPNTRGSSMSRQGFWKMIQKYAKAGGMEGKVTPGMIRHI